MKTLNWQDLHTSYFVNCEKAFTPPQLQNLGYYMYLVLVFGGLVYVPSR